MTKSRTSNLGLCSMPTKYSQFQKASEYDQETPQSHTAHQPIAP